MSNIKVLEYDKIITSAFPYYIVAISKGKMGLISLDNKILCDFIYDDVSEFNVNQGLFYKDYCIMRLGGKWGIINIFGDVLVNFQFDIPIIIERGIDDNKIIKLNNSWGLVDKNWNILVDCKYNEIINQDFNYVYKINNKKGLMDVKGNILTDAIFDFLFPYDGIENTRYYIGKIDTKAGLIDKKGKTIIDFKYEKMSVLSAVEDYFVAQDFSNHKFGVINLKNEIIAGFEYDYIEIIKTNKREDIFFHCKKEKTEILFCRKRFEIS